MSLFLAQAPVRITRKDVSKYNILGFDIDNCYPQRMQDLVNASATAKACVSIYAKFIRGKGFKSKSFYDAILNDQGLTGDKLLRRLTDDFGLHRGIAVLINYNALYQKVSFDYVPFEHARKGIKQYEGKIALYEDWDRKTGKNIQSTSIQYFDRYDPTPEVIEAQVQAAGGWENYKGQILWYSADYEIYPLASCDPVIQSILAEIASDKTTTSNLENNFALKRVFKYPGEFESEQEKLEYCKVLEEHMGPDGSQVLVIDSPEGVEDFPEIETLEDNLNDKLFQYTDEKVTKKIIRSYQQPAILHSVTDAGMFNKEQLKEAVQFYNSVTEDDRILFEELFTELCKDFTTELNPEADFSVIPIAYDGLVPIPDNFHAVATRNEKRASIGLAELDDADADKKLLVEVLGVGGTQALTAILIDTILSQDQKVSILKLLFNFSEEDAKALIYGTTNNV